MTALRRSLVAVGGAIMAYALLGALTDAAVRPFGVLLFLAVVLVAHDAVLLPAVIAGGALINRLVPSAARGAVRFAAVSSVGVLVVATPLVGGWGRAADDPSVLPLDYGRGLAVTLAALWVPAATHAVIAVHRSRAHRAPAVGPDAAPAAEPDAAPAVGPDPAP